MRTHFGGSNVHHPYNIRTRDYAAETLVELHEHEAVREFGCHCVSCRLLAWMDAHPYGGRA